MTDEPARCQGCGVTARPDELAPLTLGDRRYLWCTRCLAAWLERHRERIFRRLHQTEAETRS